MTAPRVRTARTDIIPVPGGLGITETLMRTLMRQLGNVDAAGATGAMLLVRFATLWFAVVVGCTFDLAQGAPGGTRGRSGAAAEGCGHLSARVCTRSSHDRAGARH